MGVPRLHWRRPPTVVAGTAVTTAASASPFPPYAPPAPAPAAPPCAECGEALVGAHCHGCGQARPAHDDLSLRRYVRATARELSGFDTRVVGTVVALLARPGQLTRDWLDGRRRRRLAPLAVYGLTSALYFVHAFQRYFEPQRAQFESGLRKGWLRGAGAAAPHGDAAPNFSRVFDRWVELQGYGKFASVAVLAGVAWLLYRRRGAPSGVPHVIFSLHYYAFTYLFSTLIVPGWIVLQRWAPEGGLPVQLFMGGLVVVCMAYLWRATRAVYGPRHALRNAVLLVGADLVFSSLVQGVALGVATLQTVIPHH